MPRSTKNNISLENYEDLIKTVAKVEFSRISASRHLMEFSEVLSIATMAVYVTLSSQPEKYHNNAYISTSIKWAIRNELRMRIKWYSNKHMSKENFFSDLNKEDLRETVYEAILSIEELETAENPTQIEDDHLNPEESVELRELKKAVLKAMNGLSEKEKIVLESKFFKNKKVKDIALEMGITSSRVSKIVQSALDKVKNKLIKEGVL